MNNAQKHTTMQSGLMFRTLLTAKCICCAIVSSVIAISFSSCSSDDSEEDWAYYSQLIWEELDSINYKDRIIAHRGLHHTPARSENSLAAITAAIENGIYNIEFDIRTTRDSVMVTHHEPTIRRRNITDWLFEDIAHTRLGNGELLPTLQDVLAIARKEPKMNMYIDIKSIIIDNLDSILSDYKSQAYITSDSYNISLVLINRGYRVIYYGGDVPPSQLAADGFFGMNYEKSTYLENPEYISTAKECGLNVGVYNICNLSELYYYAHSEVDMVTADISDKMLEAINGMKFE